MSARPAIASEVRIRPTAEADVAAIAELLGQLGYPSSVEQVRARLAALAASGSNYVLVAETEGQVVGLAALQIGQQLEKDDRHGQLTALVTGQHVRRKGVAQALVRAVEELAREQRCELLFLRSNKRRSDAHAFYRAEGFRETHLTFNKTLEKGARP